MQKKCRCYVVVIYPFAVEAITRELTMKFQPKQTEKDILSQACASIWNSLPEHVLQCNIINTFKRRIDGILENRGYTFSCPICLIGKQTVTHL